MVLINGRMVIFSKVSSDITTLFTTIFVCTLRRRIERDKMHRNGWQKGVPAGAARDSTATKSGQERRKTCHYFLQNGSPLTLFVFDGCKNDVQYSLFIHDEHSSGPHPDWLVASHANFQRYSLKRRQCQASQNADERKHNFSETVARCNISLTCAILLHISSDSRFSKPG